MRPETVARILEAATDLGFDFEVRQDYSGRGMLSATTTGLVVPDISELLQAVAKASFFLATTAVRTGAAASFAEHDGFVRDLKVKTDSLGRDIIVY